MRKAGEYFSFFFFSPLSAPSVTALPSSSPILPGSGGFETNSRRTERARARANLTHFRRTKSMPRAYFHVFPYTTAESTARRHSGAPPSSRAFHFVLAQFVLLRLFAALFLIPPHLALFLRAPPLSIVYLSFHARIVGSSLSHSLSVHLSFLVTPVPYPPFTCSLTLSSRPVHTFRSLANNAAAVLVPTRCFR